jgi:hypothetical protein
MDLSILLKWILQIQGVDWVPLTHVTFQWRILFDIVMNF